MRSIDIHAHLMPQCLWRTVDSGGDWYGMRVDRVPTPKVRFTPEERLRDMDAQGVDVQVVSIHTPLFGYGLEPALGRRLARDVNDEIAGMARQWPARFAGLATLPVQDVTAAIDELDRAVNVLGSEGRRARHGGERRQLGRAAVPSAVQGRRAHGRRAVLPPAAAA